MPWTRLGPVPIGTPTPTPVPMPTPRPYEAPPTPTLMLGGGPLTTGGFSTFSAATDAPPGFRIQACSSILPFVSSSIRRRSPTTW
ncbi:MAG: hypothetical protein DMD78_24885 [Candidatus Rokuibacteriota bacterium]|nr:MAG: hypothetical protein DMD78_24885 [Candidatus Rokubacteria bacterium]